MTKLYVGNLPFSATEDSVRALFAAHGNVDSVALVNDRETGRPRGFAVAARIEVFQRKLAHRLQHREAWLLITRDLTQKTLVHQRRHPIESRQCRLAGRSANTLRGIEREAAGKDRKSAEHRLLTSFAQAMGFPDVGYFGDTMVGADPASFAKYHGELTEIMA